MTLQKMTKCWLIQLKLYCVLIYKLFEKVAYSMRCFVELPIELVCEEVYRTVGSRKGCVQPVSKSPVTKGHWIEILNLWPLPCIETPKLISYRSFVSIMSRVNMSHYLAKKEIFVSTFFFKFLCTFGKYKLFLPLKRCLHIVRNSRKVFGNKAGVSSVHLKSCKPPVF